VSAQRRPIPGLVTSLPKPTSGNQGASGKRRLSPARGTDCFSRGDDGWNLQSRDETRHRRESTPAPNYEETVTAIVASAPPLTSNQRARLASLLGGAKSV